MDLKLTMLIRFIFVTSVFGTLVSGACNWPTVFTNTMWQDSSKGEIVFTTDKLSGWTIKRTGWAPIIEYDRWICHSDALYETDNILISRSEESVDLFGKQFFLYMCMELTEITEVSFRYYLHVHQEPNIDNERVFVSVLNDNTDFAKICSYTPEEIANRPSASEYRVILKSSNLDSTRIHCPYTFLGSYDYSHTSSDGTVTCNTSPVSLTTCTESTDISFDYTTCSTKIAYSVSDSVWCVDTVPSGGNNYVTLYNGNDEDSDINNSDVFRFSCLAISSDGTLASIVPNSCRKDQTPDQSNSTIGATLTLSKTVTCPLVNAPDSGNVSYTSNGAVTTANYACDLQYSLAGPDTRICQSNNMWEGEEPTCTCIFPAQPANGSFEVVVDGTLTYSCNIGFVLNGDRTRNCQSDANTWSGIEPNCDQCQPLTEPTNGSYIITSTGLTSTVAYSCDAGTTLNGDTTRTCKTDTSWNSTVPTCTSCPMLSSIASGNVTLSTDSLVTIANYYCAPGYALVGTATSTCLATGIWGSTPPTCVCNAPLSPANGTVTVSGDLQVATYTCEVGFTINGQSVRVCQSDGTGWSDNDPVCVGCSHLTSPVNGSVSLKTNGTQTVSSYACEVGFSLNGDSTSRCRVDGTWSNPTPSCSSCADLPDVTSGSFTFTTDGTSTSAEYTCDVGTTISGDVMVSCDANGVWSIASSSTSCVECPELTYAGGSYTLTSNGTFTTAELTCNTGYIVTAGDTTVRCLSNGTWSSSSTQSTCQSIESSSSSSGGGGTSLIPVVITLAILVVGLVCVVAGLGYYAYRLKKASGESKPEQNGSPSYLFPPLRAPLDHTQHVMDSRNTASAMAAPFGHPSPRVNSTTPRSMKSSQSTGSVHLSHLNFAREETSTSLIFDNNIPAPWSQKPNNGRGGVNGMDMAGTFPPINENNSLIATPRDDDHPQHKRKKKTSIGSKFKRQNSVNSTNDENESVDRKKKPIVKSESETPIDQRRVTEGRNASSPKSVVSTRKEGANVPKRRLSNQPERASTPVRHQLEIKDPHECFTPRSNTFATVQ